MPDAAASRDAAAPARHDLLAVAAGRWPDVVGTVPARPALSPAAVALVRGWGDAGWPVIARRSAPGDAPGAVPAGLPLPPAFGKARVALVIPADVPWRPVPPLLLAEVAAVAPARWSGTVADILRLARGLGLAPRVFGALLWQAATGMDYLQPTSDLDLLWDVEDAEALDPLLDGLARIAAGAPVAVDGEVLTPVGGVQWRELAQSRRREGGMVLAKSLRGAGLVRADLIPARRAPP